ncbi:putative family 17 glucosidase SCW11 [Neolecta irregularis DAH-3]|uniref:glucan endo-1,3-beta-D-glucosidase n=1 Tax=Neolecta irregularis (strain DAH-3) TaxID=1198029 RepID=A0A1U7LQC1_NEOID|nr:putative family 17 glucosidase SCW11 [Neolecta irregularis DAH-3]|eukprot:OLL24829.1 putative family 17 glucosidase SCW11 [Neolecta irregularis DAH-3]
MLMIGNEVLYSNRDTAVNLIAKIKSVRSQVVAAGYTGPIGTADTVQSYLQNPGLCASGVLDVVGLNAHPYFDADPSKSAADDGALVQSYVNQVSAACANKNIFVTETGFPNHGNTNGGMVPSYANQKTAIGSVLSVMGPNVCFFVTYQEPWKQPGRFNVEQSWGMFDLTNPSNDVW